MTTLLKTQKLIALTCIASGLFLGVTAFAAGAIGKLGNVLGKAEIVRNGKSIPAVKGMEIFATDELITEDKTAIKILFNDGGTFMAFEKAKVKIAEYQVQKNGGATSVKSAFNIAKGKIRFFVKPQPNGNDVKIKTGNAVMGIRGTSGFIDASNPQKTQLVVLTGKVEVSNPKMPNQKVLVPPNQFTDVVGMKPPTAPKPAPINLLSSLNKEASNVETGTPPASNEVKPDKKTDDKKTEPSKKDDAKQEGAVPAKAEKKTVFSPDGNSSVVVEDNKLTSVTAPDTGIKPLPPSQTVDTSSVLKQTSQATDTNKILKDVVSETVRNSTTTKKVNIKTNIPLPPPKN